MGRARARCVWESPGVRVFDNYQGGFKGWLVVKIGFSGSWGFRVCKFRALWRGVAVMGASGFGFCYLIFLVGRLVIWHKPRMFETSRVFGYMQWIRDPGIVFGEGLGRCFCYFRGFVLCGF